MNNAFVIIAVNLLIATGLAACSNTVNVYEYKYDSTLDEVFIKKGTDFSRFNAVMIDNVSVWYPQANAPAPENVEQAQANLARAQGLFRETIRNALSERYTVTDKAGSNVLRVQVEFIDLRAVPAGGPVPPDLEQFEFKTRPGHITMTARLLDSRSGEQLARAADLGKQASAGGNGVVDWEAIASDFEYWAQVFSLWLDQVHGGG